jgi:HAD superfamily hydrolase (TIGR01509 family)
MLKAIVFDMDGVIVDSEPLHFAADLLTAEDYKVRVTEDDLIAYVGTTGPDMWADLIVKYGIPDTVGGVIARQTRHKLELLAKRRMVAIPGVRELLAEARNRGLRIGLASSSPRYFIEAMIENLGIGEYFGAVVSGEEVARSKPAPDIFLRTAELLGITPGACLVVEDSGHGVRAAKAAGMACVGFVNPTSGAQDLSPADIVVKSISDIDLGML